jgi:hypothetical protein
MADTSIYSRFMPQERSMQDYLDEYDARDQRAMQNKLNGLMLQDKQRGLEEANQLRALYAQPDFDPTKPEAVSRVMRVSPTQGFALQKGQLEAQEKRGTMAKNDAETQAKLFSLAEKRYQAWQTTMGALSQQPDLTRDMAVQTGQRLVDMGIMTPEMFQGAVAKLPDDPEKLRSQILTGLKTQLTAEQMLTIFAPKVEYKDNGQQLIPVQTNPNAPGYQPPVAIQKVAGPEAVLTDQRTRSEGALNRAQSERHFNVTQGNAGNTYDPERGVVVNTRTQTATPVTQGGKPLGPKDKPMTEGQAKANLFGSRAKEADVVLGKLASQGVEQPGLIKRAAGSVPLVGGGLATMANVTQSDKQQQVEQAQRDFLNAVLRRESGAVIGAEEFANGAQQYFPQPGDKPEVIKQKARNRQLAIEGILAEVPGKAAPQRNVTVDW